MAKKKKPVNNDTYTDVFYHFTEASNVMEKRKTRKDGWDDVTKAYYSQLPPNWPYTARVTDPIIRTVLLEKTSRLFNGKLKGTVSPREGGDVIKAKIQNTILDFQWDAASLGGSMIEKWVQMDVNTRLYGASFGLVYWDKRYEGDKLVFEGNEFKVLDNRDVLVDYTATNISNSNWIQVREFVSVSDLEEKGGFELTELKDLMDKEASDRRDTRYTSISKQLKTLEDQVGTDRVFPVVEIVTEYRPDRWITIAPNYGVVLRDIECPYKHKKLPIVMLRYYPIFDDMYGESEVESVLPLARGVNATLCGYIDEMNLAMRPPIKVANNGEVRMDTLVYGPNAVWLTGSTPNNVVEHQMGGQAIQHFQTTYSALRTAINNAMGEMSQGVSNFDPNANDKTATEIRATVKQAQSRDNYNQLYLEEALKAQMMLWISNNQQFLFADPTQHTKVFRIVGESMGKELEELGLADMENGPESIDAMTSLIEETGGSMDDMELEMMAKETAMPKNPVIMNPNEADVTKYDIRPKLEKDEEGKYSNLHVTEDDMEGVYDYVPNVKSLTLGTNDLESASRNQALQLLLNPAIDAKLTQEGVKINVKDLLINVLEDSGVKNASKLFEKVQNEQPNLGGGGSLNPTQEQSGMGNFAEVPTNAPAMAGPQGLPNAGEAPIGLQ